MSPEQVAVAVGPILEAGETAQAVAAAIRRENPQAEVRHLGSYLRIACPHHCRVTRAAIEQALGRSFTLPGDLEQIMPSFRGRLRIDEQSAEWHLGAIA